MTISVIANIKAKKSDQKETLEALLKSVIEPTLQEEGCLKYELYISENDSSRYFFLEEWRSREDLDIHLASDYIQSLFGNIQSLIESSDIIEIKKKNIAVFGHYDEVFEPVNYFV
jgi:quinol monooxygenase YgiN